MPHVIEAAETGRAKCRGCGTAIAKGVLRFGERMPNPFGEGESTQWFHVDCAAFKRPEPFLQALAEGAPPPDEAAALRAEAERGVAQPRLASVDGAERSPTGRAACRACREPIAKDSWRIRLVYYEDGRFMPAGYVHARCATAHFGSADVLARVRRFSADLNDDDAKEIERELATPAQA